MNLEKISKDLNNEFELEYDSIFLDDENKTAWFNTESLASIFEVTYDNINKHINNIYNSGELDKFETSSKLDYNSNTIKIQNGFKKDKRGRKPVYYNMQVFNALGFRVHSQKAIEFRIKINKLIEGVRKGELKLIDPKNLFETISNKPTTPYRLRMVEKQLSLGIPKNKIETRVYNVKLNTELRTYLSKKKLSGHIVEVQRRLGKIALNMYPSEFRAINGIENPHHTREFCSQDQNRIFQFLEEELYEMLCNHEGDLNSRHLYKYVNNCSQRGTAYSKLLNGRITLHTSSISSKQISLDGFI